MEFLTLRLIANVLAGGFTGATLLPLIGALFFFLLAFFIASTCGARLDK